MEVNSQNITVTLTTPEVIMETGLSVEKHHWAWADWPLKSLLLMRNISHQDNSTNLNEIINKELFGLSLKKFGLYCIL